MKEKYLVSELLDNINYISFFKEVHSKSEEAFNLKIWINRIKLFNNELLKYIDDKRMELQRLYNGNLNIIYNLTEKIGNHY